MKKETERGSALAQTLVSKSWNDSSFKSQLISDPETTIESHLGIKMDVPEGSNVIVEDQSDPNHIYLNIPRDILNHETELTDEELEMVSGGGCSVKQLGKDAANACIDALHDFGDWIDDTFTE